MKTKPNRKSTAIFNIIRQGLSSGNFRRGSFALLIAATTMTLAQADESTVEKIDASTHEAKTHIKKKTRKIKKKIRDNTNNEDKVQDIKDEMNNLKDKSSDEMKKLKNKVD